MVFFSAIAEARSCFMEFRSDNGAKDRWLSLVGFGKFARGLCLPPHIRLAILALFCNTIGITHKIRKFQ